VDRQHHASLLGLAVMRGLISPEDLGQVALETRAAGGELLQAVVARGLLEAEDLRALSGLMDSHGLSDPGEPRDLPTRLEAAREEPATGDGPAWTPRPARGDQAGRRVLDALRLASWKHYRRLEFLGEGGMGRIFKATDPVLKREVALKFLARDEPERVLRFVLEAQHQALVDHPNICKVYEVGEWKGQSYIAMQLIRGRTLTQAREELTLREKVGVMQVVAEAIQAAHRQGLIHRDLKPGNIMVAREGDQLKPYLLDFGLARGQGERGLTQVGVAVGTPGYMAPEQAKGIEGGVGFAADVYAMGATLYMLLAGDPPFVDSTGLELLRRTVEEDAPPMRALLPDVPRDLDTIVLKCLEKEPAARYASALALAEDLRRFLAGEPLLAAPPPWWGVAWRKIRRNRNMSLVVGAATVALLALGTLALRASFRAHARAALAQRFGTESESLVGRYRWAQMLPLHDMRPHKAELRAWMARLEDQMRSQGPVATGPGNFALGRACLALGEAGRALAYLETAWKAGNQGPETAELLGLAHAELLKAGLEDSSRLATKALKEARRADLKRRHAEPALRFLRLSGTNPSLVQEGRIAFLEERYDEALAKGRQALARDPWLVEADLLIGRALLARARQDLERNAHDAAQAGMAGALAAATGAEAMARSQLDACELESDARQLGLELAAARGLPIAPAAQDLRAALDKALAIDPDAAAVHIKAIRLYRLWAETDTDGGRDAEPHLEEALRHSREAIRASPGDPVATLLLSMTYLVQADYRAGHGRDPLPVLEQSLAFGRTAVALTPQDSYSRNNLGLGYLSRAMHFQKHGQDPKPDLRAALASLEAANGLDPAFHYAWTNRGICWRRLGFQEAMEGRDPLPSLEQAQVCYREAARLSPGRALILNNLGVLCKFKAEQELRRGLDPRASLEEAAAALKAGLAVNPAFANLHVALGDVATLRGLQARLAGGDPQPAFQEALGHYGRALKLNGNDADTHQKLGRTWMAQARFLAVQGRASGPALDRARAAFARAVGIDPADRERLEDLARAQFVGAALDEAARSAARARAIDPEAAGPRLVEAELALGRASGASGPAREATLDAAEAGLKATEPREPWNPLRDILRAQALLLRGGPADARARRAAQAGNLLREAFRRDRLLGLDYRPWLERATRAMGGGSVPMAPARSID